MKLRNALALGLGGAALALVLVEPSLAQTPVPEAASAPAPVALVPNKGDTSWMLISSALVLMMSVPGLALFYGGLVRTKNMLSVLTQVFAIVSIVCLLWVFYGYSLAFTNGGTINDFVGGFSKAFLKGVDPNSTVATFSNGVVIPEYVYICFQMTFAMITPALIVGAFAERMKFSALVVFTILWVTLIYFPMAHMVWYWGGPDAVGNAAKALAMATDDAAKKTAQDALDAVNADAGFLFKKGALDFAGGTVVHINAGIAGFVGCLMLGKRIGYGRDLLAPHSLTMTMIGASLLWVGWFGFNAGSNLESNGTTALAMINTFVATAAAAVSWLFVEWAMKGKPSLLGMVSGAIAGLVAVTPASGFAGPMGSIVLGLVAGGVCFVMCSTVKNAIGYDDSLDVFGVHCIGGILGALATGILVDPKLGGVGIPDYATKPGEMVLGTYDMMSQFIIQAEAVGLTLLWSGIGSAILYKLVDLTIGLRVTQDEEREGLDIADHGERAYNY
ncbi:ammonium transporter [Methylobacterium sp. E-041]|jgi:Amt family ammonium transporter|uniref:ammonium transporter n=1 Tax=unclassified Methylobacterium TaxID=2615210 RepID=UPI0011C87940|nr:MULTISPECIES: ammonium transporter [unclassified Methylobacterium]MCJ2041810.1 ammonium transporter [Methylobacterium sp. J-059]MCJ2108401.1 ammonium transporter [Methylobacterium sp. E-041]MCJ2112563.1 ammonium transporter [Methylobacterium sp. E-025]TXM90815.1 ammonium transporter [Methylobacterium sp. WL116]TXN34375.1 ammonium transporter [Methylobacterium sp. WL93]